MADAHTIGIDPGSRDGAAVLLAPDGRTVRAWGAWWKLQRKSGDVMMTYTSMEQRRSVSCMERVAYGVANARGACHVVCEEMMKISGKRMTPKTLVPLAESAGRVLGALWTVRLSERRVLASKWRPRVLGLPARFDAGKAEEYAIDSATRLFDWPDWLDVEALPKRAQGAVCEAACIARWGVVTRGQG